MTMAIVVYYFVQQFRPLLHIQVLSEIIHGSSLWVQLANSYMFEILLSLYVFSIVYGRLYLGMHTVLDCVTGMLIGALSAGIRSTVVGPHGLLLHMHLKLKIFS